LNDDDDKKLVP